MGHRTCTRGHHELEYCTAYPYYFLFSRQVCNPLLWFAFFATQPAEHAVRHARERQTIEEMRFGPPEAFRSELHPPPSFWSTSTSNQVGLPRRFPKRHLLCCISPLALVGGPFYLCSTLCRPSVRDPTAAEPAYQALDVSVALGCVGCLLVVHRLAEVLWPNIFYTGADTGSIWLLIFFAFFPKIQNRCCCCCNIAMNVEAPYGREDILEVAKNIGPSVVGLVSVLDYCCCVCPAENASL